MVAEDIRRQLAARARSRRTRSATFSAKLPGEWTPTAITNPESNTPFTDDAAWEAIAAAIEGGCRIDIIILDQPPGKKGYVLELASTTNTPIYVKLQLTAEGVHGRSFHYSKLPKYTQLPKEIDDELNCRQAATRGTSAV